MTYWRFRQNAAVLLAVVFALAPLGAIAAPQSAPSPRKPAVIAPPRPYIAQITKDFEQLQDRVMRTGQVTGMAVAVVKDGKVLSQRGLGIADMTSLQPVTTQTAFRLASLSKAFAATLAGLLVDDGYLRWEDKVQDLVPVFELSNSREAPRVTVRDLLSHRVGIPHNSHDLLLERDEPYPMLVYKMRTLPMVCSVGDCYAYQNIAYSLIGDVTFSVTGDFFHHQVEKRIFHPLGMTGATYGRDALEANADYARPHVRRGRNWVAVRPKESYYRVPPAAGVNASISDMTNWMLAHLGHRPDVLSPELLTTLHTPLVSTPGERHGSPWKRMRLQAANYALGWRVYDYGGHTLVFHAGAVQGYRAMIGLLPDQDFGVVILWNCETSVPSGLMPTILDRVLGLTPQDWLQLDRFPTASGRTAAARKSK